MTSLVIANKPHGNFQMMREYSMNDSNVSQSMNSSSRNMMYQSESTAFSKDQDSHSNAMLDDFMTHVTRFNPQQQQQKNIQAIESGGGQNQPIFMTPSTSAIRNGNQYSNSNRVENSPRFAMLEYFAPRSHSNNQEGNMDRNHHQTKQPLNSLMTSTPLITNLPPSNESDFFRAASEMTPIVSRVPATPSSRNNNNNNYIEASPKARNSYANQTPRKFALCN
jgi:hypothetical protein